MKWTNNWAKKNGIRFELAYGQTLDNKEQEEKWHLRISRPEGKDIYRGCIHTERFLRFHTKEAAMDFCEKVAKGEVSMEDLKASEQKAYDAYFSQKRARNDEKVDVFFAKMQELGVNPVVVPEVLKAYSEMNNSLDGSILSVFRERLEELAQQQAAQPPDHKPTKPTLGMHLAGYQEDIDVCVCDKDTGEHYLPALCYLSDKELSNGDQYEDWESWVMSLPLDHIQDRNGCPLAVVNTDFSWDQTSFLLNENNNYDSEEWLIHSFRADWANADFAERLAFLTEKKSFEKPFDGICMDSAFPEDRQELISMLSYSPVYVCQDALDPAQLWAYSYRLTSSGNVGGYQQVPIQKTEPGKGLTASLDGKVAWIRYVAQLSSAEKEKPQAKAVEKEDANHDR